MRGTTKDERRFPQKIISFLSESGRLFWASWFWASTATALMILAFLAFIHGVPTVSVKPRTLWDTLEHPHNSLEYPKIPKHLTNNPEHPRTPNETPKHPSNQAFSQRIKIGRLRGMFLFNFMRDGVNCKWIYVKSGRPWDQKCSNAVWQWPDGRKRRLTETSEVVRRLLKTSANDPKICEG